jgi:hypothetical protein
MNTFCFFSQRESVNMVESDQQLSKVTSAAAKKGRDEYVGGREVDI